MHEGLKEASSQRGCSLGKGEQVQHQQMSSICAQAAAHTGLCSSSGQQEDFERFLKRKMTRLKELSN